MSIGRFLVIIPTYNELENISNKAPLVLSQDHRIDILIVDDASPDGTGDLAESMAAEEPRIHVLHRPKKDGLGRAYLDGFNWGISRQYDLLFEMDADISHPPAALPLMIEAAQTADVVFGSRSLHGRVTVSKWPMKRLLISYFGSWYARTITRMPVRDATGGYNCWHRRVLETVKLDRVRSNGYAFQIELKFRAWCKDFSLTEIPILFTERDSGESKMSKKIVREAVWRVWWLKILQIFRQL